MTNPCTCKAEHWQPHADSCPLAKQNKRSVGTKTKRYDLYERGDGSLTELPDGEYVTFEDYEVLRGNLTLAEEGLANYALEVERLRVFITAALDDLAHDWPRSAEDQLRTALGPAAEPSEPPAVCKGPPPGCPYIYCHSNLVCQYAVKSDCGRATYTNLKFRDSDTLPNCDACGYSYSMHDPIGFYCPIRR